uniref:Uncharacterized protein n=1 Tax=Cucumis melo TaxID=3656 RepID=A0A9I9EDA5_CUCME
MYFKNPVISLPNVPSNYITNSAAFSARSLTHYNEKNNGKQILVCEYCKKQWHTKDHCWELHSRLPRDNKRSSTSNRTQGAAMLRRLPAPLNQLALLLAKPTPYSKRHC